MSQTKVKEGAGWDIERVKVEIAILKRFETDIVQIRRSLNTLFFTEDSCFLLGFIFIVKSLLKLNYVTIEFKLDSVSDE